MYGSQIEMSKPEPPGEETADAKKEKLGSWDAEKEKYFKKKKKRDNYDDLTKEEIEGGFWCCIWCGFCCFYCWASISSGCRDCQNCGARCKESMEVCGENGCSENCGECCQNSGG